MELTFTEQLQLFASNHPILIAAWIAVFVMVIYSFYKGATNKHKVVDNNAATQLINKEDAVVLDLRSQEEFRTGHIINSVQILPSEIKAQKIQAIEKYKTTPVIVVDSNGLIAASNAEALAKQGFERVYVLKDGMSAWRGANLPTVKKQK